MKTLTIISALSLALIITGTNAVFAMHNGKNGNAPSNPTARVRYQVSINFQISEHLCNMYQVQMLDASGRQVAPPQFFTQGSLIYNFEEQTRQAAGIRIARLVMFTVGEHFVCDQELFTAPAIRLLQFKNGQAYYFDLYPTSQKPK